MSVSISLLSSLLSPLMVHTMGHASCDYKSMEARLVAIEGRERERRPLLIGAIPVMTRCLCLAFLLSTLLAADGATTVKNSLRHELTFELESRLTCFYETLKVDDRLRVSVMSMEDVKMLLQLRVSSPSNTLSDWQSGDRAARGHYNVTEEGVYEFCVHSNVKARVVLNIFAFNEAEVMKGVSEYTEMHQLGETIKKSVVTLNERLYHTLHSVKYATLSLGRDEKTQTRNADYIQRYSLALICGNLIIAIVQVVVIRRFFRETNTGKVRI